MGANNFVDNTTVRAEKFSERVWREKVEGLFWKRFMDFPMPGVAEFSQDQYISDAYGNPTGYRSKEGSAIYVVRDLVSGFGDKITFPHVQALQGEGVLGTSGDTLEGKEESMSVSSYSIELEEYAHAVADKSPLGRKRTQFDLIREMGGQIMSWGAEKTEKNIWDAFYSGTPTTILYPGSNVSTSTLTTGDEDKITMALLRKAKAIAKTRNAGSRYIIPPLKMNGKEWYVVVMSEDSLVDLKEDAEFKQSVQSAGVRGMDNPIFAGADYVTVDGIIVYGHERAKMVTTWGSGGNVPGSRIKLFGQSALCYAMGKAPSLVQQDTDYKRKRALSFQMMMKASRPSFNSIDHGSMEIRVSRSQITD